MGKPREQSEVDLCDSGASIHETPYRISLAALGLRSVLWGPSLAIARIVESTVANPDRSTHKKNCHTATQGMAIKIC